MNDDLDDPKRREDEWPERDELNTHEHSDEVESETSRDMDAERAAPQVGRDAAPRANDVQDDVDDDEPAIRETTEIVVVNTETIARGAPASSVVVNGPQESFDHNTGVKEVPKASVSVTESLPGWLIDEARDDARRAVRDGQTGMAKVMTDPLVMPGTRSEAQRDIARIGPEGMPGDAKAGPTLLRLEVVGMAILLLGLAVSVGVWFGWVFGAVLAGWAVLALMLNPVVWATLARAKDRSAAADLERDRRTVVKH